METRPMYRVGAAGLDPRDWRLVEIVFKHSQYNRYEFVLAPAVVPESIDLLIVNPFDPAGGQAMSLVGASGRRIPIIEALPRGEASPARHSITIDRLTLQLLPILNRVVDAELSGNGARPSVPPPGGAVPSASASASMAAASSAAAVAARSNAASPSAASPRVVPTDAAAAAAAAARAAAVSSRVEPAGRPSPLPLRPSIDAFDPTALDTDAPAPRSARGMADVPRVVGEGPTRGGPAPAPSSAAFAQSGPPTVRGLSQPSMGEGQVFDPRASGPARMPVPGMASPLATPPVASPARAAATGAARAPVPQPSSQPSLQPSPRPAPSARAPSAPTPSARPASARDGMRTATPESLAAPAAPARANGVPSPGRGSTPDARVGEAPKLQVLIVDDSPTVRQQLSLAFERMGMASVSVDSAAHALERLATQHIDLVLADVVMPDMDGYKLTREIKRNRQTRQIPVIILTSKSSPFDLARGALAGCDSYLSKPVPMRALEAAVVKQLRKSLAIDDLSAVIKTAEPARGKPPAAAAGPRRRPLSQWWSRSGS